MPNSLKDLPLADFYEGRILNFAHRGANRAAPENTLPAFQMAIQFGADGIEFDVQLTADDQVVVFHDLDLDRLTDGSGPLAERRLDELRELDAGSHFREEFRGTLIPTLDEVLESFGERLLLNIELKESGKPSRLAETVAQALSRHDLAHRAIVSSFSTSMLQALRRENPDIALGFLQSDLRPMLGLVAQAGLGRYEAWHPHHSLLSQNSVRRAHRRGYRVNVWTGNELDDIKRLVRFGVDAIISDNPELVQDVLQGER
ncbi:MAG: glycerophosphodiester phosphodiesterase [Chloroflexi bacterium]|nr:glycerophosphodiester phosphodiesterase [Chloroflexota bacterium]